MSVDTLLNFNGTNGSQVFTDDGLNPSIFNISSGSPILSDINEKFGTTSVYFDGSSRLSANILPPPNSWTIECFIYFNSFTTNVYQNIFMFESTSNTTIFGVFVYGDILTIFDGSNNLSNRSISESTFYHISLTYNNGELSLFVDGDKVLQLSTTRNSELINLNLGMTGHNSSPFTGYIDDFRYTSNEILYNVLSHRDFPLSELTTTTSQPPVYSDNIFTGFPKAGVNVQPKKYQHDNYTVIGGSGSGGGNPVEPPATSTNIISGNVKKLGLPFGAIVVAVSVGVSPSILGSGQSDEITGNYSIDVYPYTDEVLIYVAPEYGNNFIVDSFVGQGSLVHPTIPNRYIYIAQNDGIVGSSEPVWSTSGFITSGGVTFSPVSLHRPLMNGYIKPLVTPI